MTVVRMAGIVMSMRARLMMRVVQDCMVSMRRGSCMRVFRHMRSLVVLGAMRRTAARMARTGADKRDKARENRAEQRKEYDRLVHEARF